MSLLRGLMAEPSGPPPATDPYFASVASLLHFNGADASTTFTDVKGKIWTASSNAQIDTAQFKYGTASGLFSGVSADKIQTPHHADFDFGSGDFTVEGWLRFNSIAANNYQGIVGHDDIVGTRGWLLITGDNTEATPDGLMFAAFVGGTIYAARDTAAVATGAWFHVAACRDGGTLRLYRDGVQVGSTAIAGAINNPSTPCMAGALSVAGGDFNGWMDDLRITKGVCRYPSGTTFTPSATAFPDA